MEHSPSPEAADISSEERTHWMVDYSLTSTEYYNNRELSLLAFNERVLAQATDKHIPLLERLKFLAICSSNLDEFFEIRVAGLNQQVALSSPKVGPDGLTPSQVLKSISEITHRMVEKQYEILSDDILPSLAEEGIHFCEPDDWTAYQTEWTKEYFQKEVYPVISPIGLDFAHPFPRLVNKSLNFIFSLEGKDAFGRDSGLAIIHAPRSLPRVVQIPNTEKQTGYHFVLLSTLIQTYAKEFFPGMKVKGCYQFRVTRNSDLFMEEEDVDDLAHALKGELISRRFGDVVRLEVSHDTPEPIIQFLLRQFQLHESALYLVKGLVNFSRLLAIYGLTERPDLKYSPLPYSLRDQEETQVDYFDLLRKGDVLLHHPFQSFSHVIDFMHQAATDPNVLAIRQTLYRTGPNSVMVRALLEAARAGKEVTAVIELRARFEEEDNIELARRLQEAGALVVYGVQNYKTHAKMTLVVRRERDGLRRYVHLGTGNYHSGTTRQYTDFGLLTANAKIGQDVHKVFQQLSGMGVQSKLKRLIQAPFTLHSSILGFIQQETENAKSGKPARVIAKMNSLTDPNVIHALYEASQAGVQVDLIVRGICCLKPGIKGVSENIQVRSIVGRFLEHSRVYYFQNDDAPKVFCASADWMERNFFYRVELCFPILNPQLALRVKEEALDPYLKDNSQSWVLMPDGHYKPQETKGEEKFSAQEYLLNHLN